MKIKKRPPKSIRRHIRKEKAKIKKEFFSSSEQKEQVGKLYKKLNLIKENS